jgi:hypothetical protein
VGIIQQMEPKSHVPRVVVDETKLVKDLTNREGFARLGIAKLATLLCTIVY